ncbi:unnamed protein product [Scytosiphon promiscuus]
MKIAQTPANKRTSPAARHSRRWNFHARPLPRKTSSPLERRIRLKHGEPTHRPAQEVLTEAEERGKSTSFHHPNAVRSRSPVCLKKKLDDIFGSERAHPRSSSNGGGGGGNSGSAEAPRSTETRLETHRRGARRPTRLRAATHTHTRTPLVSVLFTMVSEFSSVRPSRRRGNAFGTALLFALLASIAPPSSRAEQVLVASLVDDITYSDIVTGGSCNDGCTREERAVAHVTGTPEQADCELQAITPFDQSIPEPGLLRASHYCEDSSGTLIEQGVRPCIYTICVDFSWSAGESDEDGELAYEVIIDRESKPSAPHTIYVDLSVAVDPTASNTDVDSCQFNATCDPIECTAPDSYAAVISMTDSYGDGWVGGVDGYYNLWELYDESDGSLRTRGTLADNHDSATIKECLPDGDFLFTTTASSAFADDMGWGICDNYGFAGEGLKFTVSNGACNGDSAEKIARATAEETEDAEYSYCTLPAPSDESDYRTSTCTALSSGMKIDGVGLFYDDRCNSADLSGCGARSIPACRLCFVDKDEWLTRFPNERVPDWEECPCCVAATLGTDCATDGGGGGTDEGVIIGVSVAIAGVIAIACCLSCAFGTTIVRFFRRLKKKKHAEDQLDLDGQFGTAAFPESPSGGGTVRGNGHTNPGNRDRGRSGHFPIPRFDSIRGRFDSGIYASNTGTGAAGAGAGAGVAINAGAHVGGAGAGDLNKIDAEPAQVSTTAQSTPSGLNGSSVAATAGSSKAPRSTVLDDRLVAQGFTTSDLGRPSSAASAASRTGGGSGGGGARAGAGWGLAMSGEYPDLEGSDPYAIDNAMVDAANGSSSGRGQ